jgi:hypothetical protein
VSIRIGEVHPSAAVVAVDLADPAAAGVCPVGQLPLLDPTEDLVELLLGHEEGVVLGDDLVVGLEIVEAFILCYTRAVEEETMSQRTSRVLSVSVPPELARDFERLAEQQGGNKSELFREMLRVYQTYQETGRFEFLQRYGAARARAVGVRDEHDVDRLIQEARHG